MVTRAGALRRSAHWARLTVRTAGELMVTFAVLVGLFIVYQLFYTNYVGRQVMDDEVAALHRQWVAAQAAPKAPVSRAGSGAAGPASAPIAPAPVLRNGDGVAVIHIPRLGTASAKAGTPVLEGVGLDVLNKAVGHYPGSALPGQVGNFSVAGHRKTHGEPFRHLDEMRTGDYVVVETADTWFTYVVDKDPYIVQPTDVDVVDPVPDRPGAVQTGRLITLTTCNPWWSSTQRMIVVGHLAGQQPKSAGPPAALG
jgi:sortase A